MYKRATSVNTIPYHQSYRGYQNHTQSLSNDEDNAYYLGNADTGKFRHRKSDEFLFSASRFLKESGCFCLLDPPRRPQ